MTKWEFAVLCLGMVLLILATTAHAADNRSAGPNAAVSLWQSGYGEVAVRD